MGSSDGPQPDERYERLVFQAKVHAAIRAAQQESEFLHFEVYRMRVFDGGREGRRDPARDRWRTVSRHLNRVRGTIREHVAKVVGLYSFTGEELAEAEPRASGDDALFDEAIADLHISHVGCSSTLRRPPGTGDDHRSDDMVTAPILLLLVLYSFRSR